MRSSPMRPAAVQVSTSTRSFLPASRTTSPAAAFAQAAKDITVFLAELGLMQPPPLPQPLKVAYHDACHLAHAQGVTQPPRTLLRSIPNLTLLEIPEGELCCGSAGTYNMEQPEIAGRLGQREAANILRTGAARSRRVTSAAWCGIRHPSEGRRPPASDLSHDAGPRHGVRAPLMTSTEVTAAPPGQGSRLPPTLVRCGIAISGCGLSAGCGSLIGSWMQQHRPAGPGISSDRLSRGVGGGQRRRPYPADPIRALGRFDRRIDRPPKSAPSS